VKSEETRRGSAVRLDLPTLQNWSCHNCGGCCRQHDIEITAEERDRILAQVWSREDGLDPNRLVEETGGSSRRRWRLSHQPDGACVFLDERGLCRMHARYGEESKPLACRLYPYTFHPDENSLRIGLRFSCPSVVSNRGTPVLAQKSKLLRLAEEVVPKGYAGVSPPLLTAGRPLDWSQLRLLTDVLGELLAETQQPVVLRLLWCLGMLSLLEGNRDLGKVPFPRLVGHTAEAVRRELPALSRQPMQPPAAMARRLFRMTVAQYSRKDTFQAGQQSWRYRWKLLRSIWRFTSGRGLTPVLQEPFRPVPFADLERSYGAMTPAMDEVLSRYLQVKVESLHFCGLAYYGAPVVEGFASLALAAAAVCYLARWLARGEGRSEWEPGDLERALAVADHHHGFSPALGQASFRGRQRWLWSQREVTRLVLWYGQ